MAHSLCSDMSYILAIFTANIEEPRVLYVMIAIPVQELIVRISYWISF